jgi:hypothetical protein
MTEVKLGIHMQKIETWLLFLILNKNQLMMDEKPKCETCENVMKQEPLYTVGVNENYYNHFGK